MPEGQGGTLANTGAQEKEGEGGGSPPSLRAIRGLVGLIWASLSMYLIVVVFLLNVWMLDDTEALRLDDAGWRRISLERLATSLAVVAADTGLMAWILIRMQRWRPATMSKRTTHLLPVLACAAQLLAALWGAYLFVSNHPRM